MKWCLPKGYSTFGFKHIETKEWVGHNSHTNISACRFVCFITRRENGKQLHLKRDACSEAKTQINMRQNFR